MKTSASRGRTDSPVEHREILGEARDHDVLIEFLAATLAGISDRLLVPGIACLLNHINRERQWGPAAPC